MPKTFRDLSITDFTCNGKCSCCGNCCGDILHLSKKEIKVIDEYLKKNKVEPTPRCVLVEYDGTCPFRDNKNKICKIYEVRPEICRVFKCDKTVKQVYEEREMTNFNKMARSMRNLFFNDRIGAEKINQITGIVVYDRNDKPIVQKMHN